MVPSLKYPLDRFALYDPATSRENAIATRRSWSPRLSVAAMPKQRELANLVRNLLPALKKEMQREQDL
jgi:hypothetical protein